jgi:hypothetical protein
MKITLYPKIKIEICCDVMKDYLFKGELSLSTGELSIQSFEHGVIYYCDNCGAKLEVIGGEKI